jgi:hypothetical protein
MFIVKLKEHRRGLKASYFDAFSSKQPIDLLLRCNTRAPNREP